MKLLLILYGGLPKNIKNDNKPCTEEAWADLKAKAVKQLSGKRLFVVDTFMWC